MFPVPSWYFSSYFSLQKVVKGWVNTLLSSNLSLISDLNDLLNSFLNVICVPNQNPQQTFRSEIWIIAVGFRDVRLGWNTWFFNSGMIFLKLTIDFLDVSFLGENVWNLLRNFFFLPGISPTLSTWNKTLRIFPPISKVKLPLKEPTCFGGSCNGKTVVGGESEGAKHHIETNRVLLQGCWFVPYTFSETSRHRWYLQI